MLLSKLPSMLFEAHEEPAGPARRYQLFKSDRNSSSASHPRSALLDVTDLGFSLPTTVPCGYALFETKRNETNLRKIPCLRARISHFAHFTG